MNWKQVLIKSRRNKLNPINRQEKIKTKNVLIKISFTLVLIDVLIVGGGWVVKKIVDKFLLVSKLVKKKNF